MYKKGFVAFGRDVASVFVLVLLAVALVGCERMQPYRVSNPDLRSAPLCNPDAQYMVPDTCQTSIVEHGSQFDSVLHRI